MQIPKLLFKSCALTVDINHLRAKAFHLACACLALAALSGCGDGDVGAGSSPVSAAAQPSWQLSGVGFKGPIANAQVCVVGVSKATSQSTQLVCTQADALGNYSLSVTPQQIAASLGPYTMQVTGGTYTDEATGQTVALDTKLVAYMGDTAASVNGTLDRQALLVSGGGVNQTSAGSGGDGLVVDDGDGGPFVGPAAPTPTSAASTKTFSSGTFNVTLASSIQLALALKQPGGLNDTNAKTAQTTVNTALGLNLNTSLVQSTPKNGSGTFDLALQSLAQLTSTKGVAPVVNADPTTASFKDDYGQAQSNLSGLPTNWIFTSAAMPNGQRLTLLPTGEINLPSLGLMRIRSSAAGAPQVLAPTGVTAVYSWLGGRVFTLCGPGNTLMGSMFAPTDDGFIPSDAGYTFLAGGGSRSATLGCGAQVTSVAQVGLQRPVVTASASVVVNGGLLRVLQRGDAPPLPSDLGLSAAAPIPPASLPAGNYLQWAGGSFNATNSYDFGFNSVAAVNFMPTPTANGGTAAVSIAVNKPDGRVFVRGNAASGNPYVSGFIEVRGFGAVLCERGPSGRLQAVAALTAGVENASIQINGAQLMNRQWRFAQNCAPGANGLGPITQTTLAAQGWTNSYAGTLSVAQMTALLLPSSTGVPAQTPLGMAGDTVFYSAFRVGPNGLVMVERVITTSGTTRDIRLFYTVD